MCDDEIRVEVSLPLDSDGFLRRQCPACERQFKWHNGPANAEAEKQPPASSYFCPFCGKAADPGNWWTTEQLEFAKATAMPVFVDHMDELLDDAFKGLDRGLVTIKKTGHLEAPDAPGPLVEPNDMTIVASSCHSFEPIKVPVEERGPLYCLVCGASFSL